MRLNWLCHEAFCCCFCYAVHHVMMLDMLVDKVDNCKVLIAYFKVSHTVVDIPQSDPAVTFCHAKGPFTQSLNTLRIHGALDTTWTLFRHNLDTILGQLRHILRTHIKICCTPHAQPRHISCTNSSFQGML